jgi:ABC-type transport system substrate-binding protein
MSFKKRGAGIASLMLAGALGLTACTEGPADTDDARLLTPDGQHVEIEIRYGAGNVPRQTMAELFQAYMSDLGITVRLNEIPDGQLSPVLNAGEFDIIIFGWSGNPAFTIAPGQYWHSGSASNFAGIANDELDVFADAVRETLALDEAAEAANAATELAVAEAAILPISDQPQVVVNSEHIQGLVTNGNVQPGPLWNVEDWSSADGEATWAVASGWSNWNLWHTDGNVSYLRQALNPLYANGGTFLPDESWEYNDAVLAGEPELINEDPMQVAYTLNPDANWGDGNPITGDDFVYQWYQRSGDEEHCDDRCAPPSTVGFDSIVSIEEDEEGRVVVTYEEGQINPEWSINYEPLGSPQHIAVENGFDWQNDPEQMGASAEWFGENPPTWSAGPYIPVDASMGEYVIYEPNPDYAGSAEPQLERLTVQVVEGTEAIITELRNGAIDGAWPASYDAEALTPLDAEDNLHYEVYEGSIWDHFDLNMSNEFLSEHALREAILVATDVDDIIDRVWTGTGVTQRMNHIFKEASPYYVDYISDTGQGSGDVARARQILEDAGYTWEE